jgi:hypothetical protein
MDALDTTVFGTTRLQKNMDAPRLAVYVDDVPTTSP